MDERLDRSILEPIRERLSWDELWRGPDKGLIWCWERGRQERIQKPALAARADAGELIPLDWKGGVREKSQTEKRGCLNYLATWQGLRGEDLNIALDAEIRLQCSKTDQIVVFSQQLLFDE
jgi:hypothetical protein